MRVEVFDSSMCRSPGVCGPSVDPVVLRFAADLEWLAGRGVEVSRHNLERDPAAFAAAPAVQAALSERGTDCLPLILVDGRVVSQGTCPTRAELAGWTGLGSKLSPEALAELLAAIDAAIAAKKKSRCC